MLPNWRVGLAPFAKQKLLRPKQFGGTDWMRRRCLILRELCMSNWARSVMRCRLQLEHAQQQELLRQQAGQVVTALQDDQVALAYQAAQAVARAEAAERLVLEQRAFAKQQFANLAARADEAERARAAAEQTVQTKVLEAQESLRQQFTLLFNVGLPRESKGLNIKSATLIQERKR